MTAPAFDTLKAAKALEDAGFGEAQAEAVVATVGDAVREHTAPLASSMATIADGMATKEYVATIADRMVTKEQFAATADTLATKEQLAATADTLATKEQLAATADRMVTREQLAAAVGTLATKEQLAATAGRMVTEERFAATVVTLATKEYVAAAIAGLRADMMVEFKNLYRHLWVMGTSIVGLTVVLIKLLP